VLLINSCHFSIFMALSTAPCWLFKGNICKIMSLNLIKFLEGCEEIEKE